ncbi:MAG: radical SAM protein, partial [Candidatus Methylomirabilota bacterium]
MPDIPEITFREFADRLDLEARHVPIEGTIETTFRCNLRCAHCYVNRPIGDREARSRELSSARLLGLIDEIAEAGCLALTFTGGEPLVRPDFPAVYLHAIRRGLLVTVFTNGTLLDDRIADLFDAQRPERVEVSLYGMTEETSERISGVPGSHAACLQGIHRLHARGIPFRLKTMTMTWNRSEIPAMASYARSLQVGFTWDGLLNPRLDGGTSRIGELQLPAEEILAVDLEDPARIGELCAFCARAVRPGETGPSQTVYTCGAGRTAFAVDPYGWLHPCLLSRKAGVDLGAASFQEGWSEGFEAFRRQAWTRPSPCRS